MAKKIQKEIINTNRNKQLLLNAKNIINEKLEKGEDIISNDIYNALGVNRTSLVQTSPKVTNQIHLMLKNSKYGIMIK
jgi:hypothetical protein